jgi:flotillin
MEFAPTLAFVLIVVALVFFGAVIALAARLRKVGPNQVLVISGRGETKVDPATGKKVRRQYRIVTGGSAFIWPVLERVDTLWLELMTIEVRTEEVYTVKGVPVTVDGVAQIKIGSDDVSIATAAERFLSKTQAEILHVAHETLAGHLRAMLGTLTVEEIYRERDKFAQQVQETSGPDMANMGLAIDSFVIKNIQDDQGYLDALGRPRTAEVKRDATIGEAEAARDATIRSAAARQEGETAKFQAETKIAESQRDYEVQKAAYDQVTNRQQVIAELERDLQDNKSQQQIRAEAVQIQVIEKQKQILVQEQEALRKEKELLGTVRKPAEAEQYRIQTLAKAKKFQTETEASGEAEAFRQIGTGQADANKARGLAEADVIRAQGSAEATAMEKKAAAWQQYNQAAIIQQLVEALPKVAEAIASPLAQTDRLVIINNGGDGGGASRLTADINSIVAQVPETLEALTGVNLVEMLKALPGLGEAAGEDKE